MTDKEITKQPTIVEKDPLFPEVLSLNQSAERISDRQNKKGPGTDGKSVRLPNWIDCNDLLGRDPRVSTKASFPDSVPILRNRTNPLNERWPGFTVKVPGDATGNGVLQPNHIETTSSDSDLHRKASKSSYTALDAEDQKLLVEARNELGELYELIPVQSRGRSQKLDAWRSELDSFEHSGGDPQLDRGQRVIDNLRIQLLDLDRKVPAEKLADRKLLDDWHAQLDKMQQDLHDQWKVQLKDLHDTIVRDRAIERFAAPRPHSVPEFRTPTYIKINGVWQNLTP